MINMSRGDFQLKMGLTPGALVTVASAVNVSGPCRSATWVDVDSDGLLDLFVCRKSNYSNVLFRNLGANGFSDVTLTSGDTSFRAAGEHVAGVFGDWDRDGDLDLVVTRDSGGGCKIFRNAAGYFTDVTSSVGLASISGSCVSACWGDYDNDDDLDLYVGKSGGASNQLMRNDAGQFVDATSGPLGNVGSARGVQWGDFDVDGDLDLVLSNDNGESSRLFRNDGAGAFAEDAVAFGVAQVGYGQGLAVCDFNADGSPDVVTAESNTGGNTKKSRVLRNDFANATVPGTWIRVRLQGGSANRFGVGARVTAKVGNVLRTRVVGLSSGYLSQDEDLACFGFPPSVGNVDTLEVWW